MNIVLLRTIIQEQTQISKEKYLECDIQVEMEIGSSLIKDVILSVFGVIRKHTSKGIAKKY